MESGERVDGLGTKKLFPMIISMSVPAICGNITTALYNVVDRLFVGQCAGRNGLGAIGLMFPLNNVTAAVSVLLTIGGGALISLSLGKKDMEKANDTYTNIVVMGTVLALLISFLFIAFADGLITACGASGASALHDMAVEYLKIVAVGQFFHILNLALAGVIRAEGNVTYAMIVTMAGAVLNVALDAFFILALGAGLAGAAVATAISQFVGALLSALYFIRRKSVLCWSGFKRASLRRMAEIAGLGSAPAVFQGFGLFNNLLVNNALMQYGNLEMGSGGGDLAISALSVIHTVESIALMAVLGMNNAISTILSYNYGAKHYRRVKDAALIGQGLAFAVCVAVWAAMMFMPEMLFSLFGSKNDGLASYGVMAMRKSKMMVLFLGFQTLASMYFSAIGKPKTATFISISRNGLFLIPALLILPRVMGLDGVLYSSSVSDFCSMILVAGIYFTGIWELNKKSREMNEQRRC